MYISTLHVYFLLPPPLYQVLRSPSAPHTSDEIIAGVEYHAEVRGGERFVEKGWGIRVVDL